jgi:hypothetical protein
LRRLLHISSFDVSLRASFGVNTAANSCGGDGMVFIFAPVATWPEGGGGTLGFNGCLGYGVEFDTYQNPELGDPSHEHVAVIKDVSSNHLHSELLAVPTLENGRMHDLRISLRDRRIRVWINEELRLEYSDVQGFSPFDGYLAVSAATGAAFNEHILDDIRVAMPTRRSTAFGPFSICGPRRIDTTIIISNSHDFGAREIIFEMATISTTPDVISGPTNSELWVLPYQGDLAFPLRFELPGEGTWQAILELKSAVGDVVHDTLFVTAAAPRLAWSVASVDFSAQPAGALRDSVLYLKNIGIVDAEVRDVMTTAGFASASVSRTLPYMLPAGDSIAVRIGVRPVGAGLFSDSILVDGGCGDIPALPIRATAFYEALVLSFPQPALMLNPGRQGRLSLHVDTLPEFTPVFSLEGAFTVAAPELRYDGQAYRGPALPAAADVTVVETFPGRIEWRVRSSTPLRTSGTLVEFSFTANSAEQRCHDVIALHTRANHDVPGQSEMPVTLEQGRICINASCRHPLGLRLAEAPELRIHPNPVTTEGLVILDLAAEGYCDVALRDVLGRLRRTVSSAYLHEGAHTLYFSTDGLAAGMYVITATQNGRSASAAVLIRR